MNTKKDLRSLISYYTGFYLIFWYRINQKSVMFPTALARNWLNTYVMFKLWYVIKETLDKLNVIPCIDGFWKQLIDVISSKQHYVRLGFFPLIRLHTRFGHLLGNGTLARTNKSRLITLAVRPVILSGGLFDVEFQLFRDLGPPARWTVDLQTPSNAKSDRLCSSRIQ